MLEWSTWMQIHFTMETAHKSKFSGLATNIHRFDYCLKILTFCTLEQGDSHAYIITVTKHRIHVRLSLSHGTLSALAHILQ